MHERNQFTTSRFAQHRADSEFETAHHASDEVLSGYDDGNVSYESPRSALRFTTADSSETYTSMNSRHDVDPFTFDDDYSLDRDYALNEGEYLSVDDYTPDAPEQEIPGFTPRGSAATPPRGGAHRLPIPPSALKGRAAVLAVAAGAVVAAGQAAVSHATSADHSEVSLAGDEGQTLVASAAPQAAQYTDTGYSSAPTSTAPQVLNIANPTDLSQFSNLLEKGQRFAEERAAREEAARRPLFVMPTIGVFTSSFGARWGTLHAGVDIAAPIGTPIVSVADGTVIESGPASGFGMWVRVQHDDGTVTIYGHVNETLVSQGQRVVAGEQIATVGNRGWSTGPHLHFEVHLNGADKVDPVQWLAARGLNLGYERD